MFVYDIAGKSVLTETYPRLTEECDETQEDADVEHVQLHV